MSSANGQHLSNGDATNNSENITSTRKRQFEETENLKNNKDTLIDKKSKKHPEGENAHENNRHLDDYDDEHTGDSIEGKQVYEVEEHDYLEEEPEDSDFSGENEGVHDKDSDEADDIEDLPERFKELKWEDTYVEKMASFVGAKGGKILIVGYGTGIGASTIAIQGNVSHIYIIEEDEQLFEYLKERVEAEYPDIVTCYKGAWQDKIKEYGENEFDGVLYYSHPYIITPNKSGNDDSNESHFDFISKMGYRILKKGGRMSYCNIRSWGDHLKNDVYQNNVMKMFETSQVEKLKKIGFSPENIEIELEDVSVPEGCKYYSHEQVMLVKLTK
ncbi:unnamed protein product [Gordionus sp. m RMFG-2023]|uniref:guanidinoacetate N-methyltransferase-like n=1 Tax=Gordionus sp. m RMFG-2023 TaxID=3053472 RepID=UPI0030E14FC7